MKLSGMKPDPPSRALAGPTWVGRSGFTPARFTVPADPEFPPVLGGAGRHLAGKILADV